MSEAPGAILNAAGERIDAAYVAGADPRALLAVIGHGVTANKDRDWARTLAGELSAAGFATLRFSFAGNGESGGEFGACTVSKEVADLGAVLDAIGPRRVCYIGHSMGAAVGVLRAVADSRIHALVSLAGMVHTAAFAERKFGRLTPGRDVMWDKPDCPLSQRFIDDMMRIDSVLPSAPRVAVPWLLVHGTADDVVPHAESLAMRDAAGSASEVELISIDGADHLFSGDDERTMAVAVTDWLRRVSRSSHGTIRP